MEMSSFSVLFPALPPVAHPQQPDNHEINRHKATDTASHVLPLKQKYIFF